MSKISTTAPDDALSAGGSKALLARMQASKFHDEMTAFINAEIQRPEFEEAHLLSAFLQYFLYTHASMTAQFLKPSGDSVTRDAIIRAVNVVYCDHCAEVRAHLAQEREGRA